MHATFVVLGLVLLGCLSAQGASRTVSAPVVGLRDASPRVHALVGARIVVSPGKVVEHGTLVLRDGVVAAVGADVAVPADARVWDVTGCTLYPGFIESHSTLLLPEAFKPAAPTPRDEAAERPARRHHRCPWWASARPIRAWRPSRACCAS